MEITINGKRADITLDNEKTVGEVMVGLEQWISASGHRISGFSVDAENVTASMVEDVFSRDKNSVSALDVQTSSLANLSAISLASILDDIDEYDRLDFEDKKKFLAEWQDRVQVKFITEQIPELLPLCVNAFSKGDILTSTLRSMIEEMKREVIDPVNEMKTIEPVINDTCSRLIDLPLDIQTGKDARAAQTIQFFTAITEKILRIIRQLNAQGFLPQAGNDRPIINLINEFAKTVNDLMEAYEKKDTILVGDLAEYETSPKLMELYTAVLTKSRETAASQELS